MNCAITPVLNGPPAAVDADFSWYALFTLSKHERLVVHELAAQGIATFFPTFVEIHHWSDRRKKVEVPLYPGYVFLRALLTPQLRHRVLRARGNAGFITMQGEPVPIPDIQIESVRKVIAHAQCTEYPYLKSGGRVRVRGGALDGVVGILLRSNKGRSLVVSVDAISRSLALRIEGYDLEAA